MISHIQLYRTLATRVSKRAQDAVVACRWHDGVPDQVSAAANEHVWRQTDSVIDEPIHLVKDLLTTQLLS